MARITINDEKLYADIVDYCKVNNEKIGDFCTKLLKSAFAIEVYGDVPFGFVVAKYPNDKEEEAKAEPVEEKVEEPIKKEEVVEEKTVEEKIAELEKEAQEVIDEHTRLMKEKNEKPRKRRL